MEGGERRVCAIEQRGRRPCIGDDAINFARKKYILQFETNTLCNLKQIHLMNGEEGVCNRTKRKKAL